MYKISPTTTLRSAITKRMGEFNPILNIANSFEVQVAARYYAPRQRRLSINVKKGLRKQNSISVVQKKKLSAIINVIIDISTERLRDPK